MKNVFLSLALLATIAPAHAFMTTPGGSCSGCKVILQVDDVKEEAAQFMLNGAVVTARFDELYNTAKAIIAAELGAEAADALTIEDFALQILAQP